MLKGSVTQPLHVLIVGAGRYVCGRGTEDYGTILPTVLDAHAQGCVGEIAVAGASQEGIALCQQKATDYQRRLGVRAPLRYYPAEPGRDPSSYRRALAELSRPACAVIAVPDHLHAPIAEEALQAGLHVLLVKPFTATLAEGQRLVALAEARQCYGAVDFHKRFDEANLLLRQALRDGALGAVRYITVAFSQRRAIREAFRPWIQHTNVFQYLGVHYADLIYFVTRATPLRVLATGQPHAAARSEVWACDAIQAVVEWAEPRRGERFVSQIATHWVDPDGSSAMSDQTITVIGSDGRYQSDQKHRGVQQVSLPRGIEDINPYFSQRYADATEATRMHGYGPRSIQQFLQDAREVAAGTRQVRELQRTRPSFQEALVSTAICDAVRRSLAQGETWIDVEDVGVEAETAPSRLQEAPQT